MSGAPVCRDELLSGARQKTGEGRPPVERGALGLALAHASVLSLSLLIPQSRRFSPCATSSALLHSAPGHLHKLLLISELSFPALCKGGFFLDVVEKFHSREVLFEPEPKIYLVLKLVTSCFYLLLYSICHKFNSGTSSPYMCLSFPQAGRLHEGRDFVSFLQHVTDCLAFSRYSINIW